MELKHYQMSNIHHPDSCFNRTFMELKQYLSLLHDYASNSFNRTFMELKHVIRLQGSELLWVLIGPSWN